MLPLSSLVNSFLSEMLVLVALGAVVVLIFRFTKIGHRLIFGVLANSIAGIISIFAINAFFSAGLPFSAPVLLSAFLFGLPAVGSLILLKLGGLVFV